MTHCAEETRILGGCRVREGEMPWLCGLEVREHQCGATLLQVQDHHTVLLTAAHCLNQVRQFMVMMTMMTLLIMTMMTLMVMTMIMTMMMMLMTMMMTMTMMMMMMTMMMMMMMTMTRCLLERCGWCVTILSWRTEF